MAKWIQKAISHPGRIKRALGISEGEKIPSKKMGRLRKIAEGGGSLGAAARLALRFKKGEFNKVDKNLPTRKNKFPKVTDTK